MNILITGLHGFVGSNLIQSLKLKHTLYGIDIIAPDKEGVLETFFWSDLTTNKIPEVDVIIHLAGKAHDTKNQSDAKVYFEINTGLTKTIYDYFLTSKARKFIFFSSVKAVADFVIGDVLTEDVVPAVQGPYGESKQLAEKYLQEHLPEVSSGKKVYILRPCMIHGSGNKGNLNLLYKVVKIGMPWPLGSFENYRSFTSIDNLCFVMNGLLMGDIDSGIYNMADDEVLSTNELIQIMGEVLGHKVHIWKLPKSLMIVVAKGCGALHLPLNNESLKKLTENYVVSNEKIKAALGVDGMPTDAREGFRRTLYSFRNRNAVL